VNIGWFNRMKKLIQLLFISWLGFGINLRFRHISMKHNFVCERWVCYIPTSLGENQYKNNNSNNNNNNNISYLATYTYFFLILSSLPSHHNHFCSHLPTATTTNHLPSPTHPHCHNRPYATAVIVPWSSKRRCH